MTNEWKEFLAYTEQPFYIAAGKRDHTYLGRFTFDTLTEFEGLGRILTVLARGYLFHDKDGALLAGSAYDRAEYARDALCAWCSVPDSKKSSVPPVDFRKLSAGFPELVNGGGEGWLYRHVRAIARFVKKCPELVDIRAQEKCATIAKGFAAQWKKKVRQFQVPLFAVNTKGAWTLRFDDIIADALEAGPLRREEYPLPTVITERLQNTDLNGVPLSVVEEVLRYYLANRREDTDWVVLPVASFDCFFGNTYFSRKYLRRIPDAILERSRQALGVCRVRLLLNHK